MADLGNTSKAEHFISLHDIEDALECIICLEFPKSTPVYQCDNGHILCNSCHGRITECPTCRTRLGKIRCLAVEKVLAQCPRPCSFKSYNCNIELTERALETHEETCVYKPVICPSLQCKKLMSCNEIISHVIEGHQSCDVDISQQYATVKNVYLNVSNQNYTTLSLHHWTFDGHNFIGTCWKDWRRES